MTEAELWELIVAYNGNAMTGVTIYFSALTGYLIVAYMIGNRLTSMQTTIITVGFVVFQFLMIFATVGLAKRAVFLIGKHNRDQHGPPLLDAQFNAFGICQISLLLSDFDPEWRIRPPCATILVLGWEWFKNGLRRGMVGHGRSRTVRRGPWTEKPPPKKGERPKGGGGSFRPVGMWEYGQ